LFSLILPLLLSGFAIGYGASTVAGEEHSGQLDVLLALPIRRSRLIAEKVAAVALSVFALTVLSAAVIVGVGTLVNLDLSTTNIAAACTGSGLVALLRGVLALTIRAGTGNRGLALGVSAAVFIAGYLLQALSGLVDALRPARILSPLYHANDTVPINTGWPGWHFAPPRRGLPRAGHRCRAAVPPPRHQPVARSEPVLRCLVAPIRPCRGLDGRDGCGTLDSSLRGVRVGRVVVMLLE
jgi:hypothetical protein